MCSLALKASPLAAIMADFCTAVTPTTATLRPYKRKHFSVSLQKVRQGMELTLNIYYSLGLFNRSQIGDSFLIFTINRNRHFMKIVSKYRLLKILYRVRCIKALNKIVADNILNFIIIIGNL